MFTTADPVTQGALTVLICVSMGTCLLIVVAIFRRWQQTRYALHVQSVQDQFRPYLTPLFAGTWTPESIDVLRRLRPRELELLFDPLFAKGAAKEYHVGILLAVCTQLGLVERWQSRLATVEESQNRSSRPQPGRRPAPASCRLLQRAKSIRNLGMLRHQPSWPLLVKALDDLQPDIQSVALHALASIRARESFPVLLERLQAVALRDLPSLPRKILQATLACFDPSCSPDLLPLLRHEDWKLRFLALEILRGMVYRRAATEPNFILASSILAPEVAELLVTDLWRDTSGSVRGRAGEVIAFLSHSRSAAVLQELLFDPQWYVRLQIVQALARPRHCNTLMLPRIRECLHDPHWRVREAAATTLISFGAQGRQELYGSFLTSHDQAVREQIVEALERRGLMASLIQEYAEGVSGLSALVTEELAGGAAPRGFPEVLRVSATTSRQMFQERFLPYTRLKMQLQEGAPNLHVETNLQSPLEFPPTLAA